MSDQVIQCFCASVHNSQEGVIHSDWSHTQHQLRTVPRVCIQGWIWDFSSAWFLFFVSTHVPYSAPRGVQVGTQNLCPVTASHTLCSCSFPAPPWSTRFTTHVQNKFMAKVPWLCLLVLSPTYQRRFSNWEQEHMAGKSSRIRVHSGVRGVFVVLCVFTLNHHSKIQEWLREVTCEKTLDFGTLW